MRGTEDDRRIIRTILSHPDPHPNRDPRYSAGTWDGVHRFYTRDGRCFLRGLLEMVVDRLEDEEIEYSLQEPQRPVKTWDIPEDFLRGIKLRDYQREAVERSLEHRRGILRIPPRGGKTECQIAVAQALNKPSLLLVNKQKLLRQHYNPFSQARPPRRRPSRRGPSRDRSPAPDRDDPDAGACAGRSGPLGARPARLSRPGAV